MSGTALAARPEAVLREVRVGHVHGGGQLRGRPRCGHAVWCGRRAEHHAGREDGLGFAVVLWTERLQDAGHRKYNRMRCPTATVAVLPLAASNQAAARFLSWVHWTADVSVAAALARAKEAADHLVVRKQRRLWSSDLQVAECKCRAFRGSGGIVATVAFQTQPSDVGLDSKSVIASSTH